MTIHEYIDDFDGITSSGSLPPLPALSVRGGRFRLVRAGGETTLEVLRLHVILIGTVPGGTTSRRFFNEPYSEGKDAEGNPPTCSSRLGDKPDAWAAAPQAALCRDCLLNAWGSARRQDGSPGKGKACSDYRRLVVLPVGIPGVGEEMFYLDISPTGLRTFAAYNDFLRARSQSPRSVVSEIAFNPEVTWPQLTWNSVQALSPEQVAHVQSLRKHPDVVATLDGVQQSAPVALPPPVVAPALPPPVAAHGGPVIYPPEWHQAPGSPVVSPPAVLLPAAAPAWFPTLGGPAISPPAMAPVPPPATAPTPVQPLVGEVVKTRKPRAAKPVPVGPSLAQVVEERAELVLTPPAPGRDPKIEKYLSQLPEDKRAAFAALPETMLSMLAASS